MKPIRSFVRRNSRMTDAQKRYFSMLEGVGYEQVQEKLSAYSFVGLEIGFGMGDSLIETAQNSPEQLWLGVEVFHAGIAAVIQAASKMQLENVLAFEGDVETILDQELRQTQFDMVRIFFPDPWPKKRHHKRRLVQKSFVDHILTRLKPGGVLHFATDNQNYAEAVSELLSHYEGLTVSEPPARPLTKYARKAIASGSVIFDIAVSKT